jgi:hypothetical protein
MSNRPKKWKTKESRRLASEVKKIDQDWPIDEIVERYSKNSRRQENYDSGTGFHFMIPRASAYRNQPAGLPANQSTEPHTKRASSYHFSK